MAAKLIALVTLLAFALGAAPAMAVEKSAKGKSGSCGEFMYMKDGKCLDARDKKKEKE